MKIPLLEVLEGINIHIYRNFVYRVFDIDEVLIFVSEFPRFKQLLDEWIWKEFARHPGTVIELVPTVAIPEEYYDELFPDGKTILALTTEAVEVAVDPDADEHNERVRNQD